MRDIDFEKLSAERDESVRCIKRRDIGLRVENDCRKALLARLIHEAGEDESTGSAATRLWQHRHAPDVPDAGVVGVELRGQQAPGADRSAARITCDRVDRKRIPLIPLEFARNPLLDYEDRFAYPTRVAAQHIPVADKHLRGTRL